MHDEECSSELFLGEGVDKSAAVISIKYNSLMLSKDSVSSIIDRVTIQLAGQLAHNLTSNQEKKTKMNAFITGSYAYGTPTEKSDIDLVVLLNGLTKETEILWKHSRPDVTTCMYGSLNLITFADEKRFNDWKKVTEELIKQKPVTRDVAVAAFNKAGFNLADYENKR